MQDKDKQWALRYSDYVDDTNLPKEGDLSNIWWSIEMFETSEGDGRLVTKNMPPCAGHLTTYLMWTEKWFGGWFIYEAKSHIPVESKEPGEIDIIVPNS